LYWLGFSTQLPKWSSSFGNIAAAVVAVVAVKVITEVPLSSPGDQKCRIINMMILIIMMITMIMVLKMFIALSQYIFKLGPPDFERK